MITSSFRLDAYRQQRKMKRSRAIRNGAGVRGADEVGKLPLESGDFRTLRDPSAENDPGSRVRLTLVHHGFDDGDHWMLCLFSRHHATRRCNPSSRSDSRLEAQHVLGFGDIRKPT